MFHVFCVFRSSSDLEFVIPGVIEVIKLQVANDLTMFHGELLLKVVQHFACVDVNTVSSNHNLKQKILVSYCR